MKKILLLLGLFGLTTLSLQAQEPASHWHTQAGRFLIEPNQGIISESMAANLATYQGYRYAMIQFYQLPNDLVLKQLNQSNIERLSYSPGNIYAVRFPESVSLSVLQSLNLRAAWPITPEHKIHDKVKMHDVPGYAIRGEERVYMASVYPEITAKEILHDMQQMGVRIEYVYNDQHIRFQAHPSVIHQIASIPAVQFIDWAPAPLTKDNLRNRTDHRSNVLKADYGAGRQYDGTGVRVALTDDGFIGPHIDYTGRTTQTAVLTYNTGDHGDHCGGTIMSAGNLDPNGRGMAPGCHLWVYNALDSVNYILHDSLFTAPSTSIDIVSTSYSDGCNSGYNAGAESADRQIRTYKNIMRVFSAGNDGTSNCSYGAGANWGNITGGIKSAKNLIAVANLTYQDLLANSSSRGPATDGRIKPDVSAVGTDVYSTVDPNDYALKTGTSMSCPGVAGLFTQMYHAYRELNAGQDPHAGLLKNILMNTCDDISNPGPDYKTGYGRVNGFRAIKVMEANQYMHDSVSTGNTKSFTLNVPANVQRVKIMLSWLDREAAVNATTALINDLDLKVINPSSATFLPWTLNPAPNATTLNANAVRAADHLNNIEQVTIDNPAAGNYTLEVNGFAIPFGPQEFHISYEFILNNSLDMTYPIGGEGFKPGESQTLRWDALPDGNTFSLDYSTDNGANWSSIATGIAATQLLYNWTIPNTVSGSCRVRVSRNGTQAMSPANFSIINTPGNLAIHRVCPDTITLKWSSVSGATHYDVFMLGSMYMDSIGTTTDTFYHVTGLNITDAHWFSVRARSNPQLAVGTRAFAIQQLPGLSNCILAIDAENTGSTTPGNLSLLDCAPINNLTVNMQIKNNGMNSITGFPVSYQLNGGSPVTENFGATLVAGSTQTYNFTTPIALSSLNNGLNILKIWCNLSGDLYHLNDTMSYSILLENSTTVSMPWSVNFQSMAICPDVSFCDTTTCSLLNDLVNETNGWADDFDWKVNAGATPTSNTGPDTDHTTGTATGRYIYLETSYCFNQKGYLLTPCFNFSTTAKPFLSYWYHMYGNGMGELHVDAHVDGLWQLDIVPPVNGDQGNSWKNQTKDLSNYAGKTVYFRFRGLTGSNQRSDMALDDLMINDTSGSTTGLTDIETSFLVYPNPSGGVVTIENNGNKPMTNIQVLDATGKQVGNHAANGQTKQHISISHLSNGFYWLILKEDEKVIYRTKLIRQE